MLIINSGTKRSLEILFTNLASYAIQLFVVSGGKIELLFPIKKINPFI